MYPLIFVVDLLDYAGTGSLEKLLTDDIMYWLHKYLYKWLLESKILGCKNWFLYLYPSHTVPAT